jgi:hypothetical protein
MSFQILLPNAYRILAAGQGVAFRPALPAPRVTDKVRNGAPGPGAAAGAGCDMRIRYADEIDEQRHTNTDPPPPIQRPFGVRTIYHARSSARPMKERASHSRPINIAPQ